MTKLPLLQPFLGEGITKVCLFGTGVRSQRLHQTFTQFQVPFDFFCDNNPEKQGIPIDGHPCLSFDQLQAHKEEVLVIVTPQEQGAILAQLKDFPHVLPLHTLMDCMISDIELNLVDHCDLDCQCCSHFSNISKEYCTPLHHIENDLQRLSLLCEKKLIRLRLIGGEPLLHPDLVDIMKIARHHFPFTEILVVTNGVKLKTMAPLFWETCHQQGIAIAQTKYPIALDHEGIRALAQTHQVPFRYFNDGNVLKTSLRFPLDLEKTQHLQTSYDLCHQAKSCAMVMEGKLYLCPVTATSHIFNEKFGDKLEILPKDYLILEETKDMTDIAAFLNKPCPFCGYCDIQHIVQNIPWKRTTGNIEEWLL